MVSLNPPTKSNICIACGLKPKEKFGNCISCYEKLLRKFGSKPSTAIVTNKKAICGSCGKEHEYNYSSEFPYSNCIDCLKTKGCVCCGINLREDLNPYCYCKTCDMKFGVRSTPAKDSWCFSCGENYYKSKGHHCKKSCVTYKNPENIAIRQELIALNKEVNKNEFFNLKQELEVDKDILSPAEMKLYSDTKQVWWIRVIKWILKYI